MAAPKTNKMNCGRCAMQPHDVNAMVLKGYMMWMRWHRYRKQ